MPYIWSRLYSTLRALIPKLNGSIHLKTSGQTGITISIPIALGHYIKGYLSCACSKLVLRYDNAKTVFEF